MSFRGKPVLEHDFLLRCLQPGIGNLDEASAIRADKVVMMAVTKQVLVTGGTVFELEFAAKPGVAEQLEGAVHRGGTDPRRALSDGLAEFFRSEMPVYAKERLQDGFPLAAAPEPVRRDKPAEHTLFLRYCHALSPFR